MQIKDGTGSGDLAGVVDNRLLVSSRSEERLFYASRDDGQAYAWVTATSTTAANDTILLIKNTSKTKNLFIDHLGLTLASASVVTVHRPTTLVATPTGTAVTGVNLNGQSANVADASAKKDETTNSQGDVFLKIQAVAATPIERDLKGAVILGPDQSIGIDVVATQASFECNIVGWFEEA